ncbi:MAG: amino acid adenylation domain-containing protein [Verrucomicrobia bacterium]|nr:amino acid adenylation domain-containing protein [Verrucomicrobiota bacterium]
MQNKTTIFLDKFTRSDSIELSESFTEDDALIKASICFLIFRYTAKKTVELPICKQDETLLRRWEINDKTGAEDLKGNFRETLSNSDNLPSTEELSVWNPLYLETKNEEKIGNALSQIQLNGFEPDILFVVSGDSIVSTTIYSSHRNHSSDYLCQIHQHWIHSIHLLQNNNKGPICQLPVLTDTEYDLMIHQWNDNDRPRDVGKFDFEKFDIQVTKHPDKIAITSGSESLSYLELQNKTNQLAHYLQGLGIGPEVVVGIYLNRSIEFVVSLVALKKSGGAFLPLDPEHPKDRKEYLIENSKVPFIITSTKWKQSLPDGNFRSIVLEEIENELCSLPTHTPGHGLKAGNMSYLFYTSGSTGKPKGVMMTLDYLQKREPDNSDEFRRKIEKVLLKSSTGFTLILLETFAPLQTGGEIVVVPTDKDKDADWLLRTIQNKQVESLNLVPSMLSFLLLQEGIERCTSLKKVYTVGERLPVSVQKEFFKKLPNAKLFMFYGCTEAPAATFREILPDEDYGNRIILGKPMVNKKMYLLDEFRVPVPVGVPGEIYIGGPISRGYIHNDALTQERFLPNPFTGSAGGRMYQTGDIGRFLEDGSIEYLGRTDFQVQIRGIRIELGEIESCLSSHSKINEAVVLAKISPQKNTLLVAYYIANTDKKNPSDTELRKHIRGNMPDYMVPAIFIQLDSFPVNANGKIDRLNFPDPDSIRRIRNGRFVFEGYSATEYNLNTIFWRVLGSHHILKSDSFFDIGGDSLLAVEAINHINKEFDIKLRVPDFYEHPTIIDLGKLINSSGFKSKFDLLVKIRSGVGSRKLFMLSISTTANSHISKEFDIYTMRGVWYNELFDFSDTLSSLADRYLEEILVAQPTGPFYLGGFSLGGTIAHQIACKLQAKGHEVAKLYLLDPSPINLGEKRASRNNFSAIGYHIKNHGLRDGLGVILSYCLNFLSLPILVRHRVHLAMAYIRSMISVSHAEQYQGDLRLYHKIDYGTNNIEQWKKLTSGKVETIELPTEKHMAIYLDPIQKIWCEEIRP